jgi:hypothetical protein
MQETAAVQGSPLLRGLNIGKSAPVQGSKHRVGYQNRKVISEGAGERYGVRGRDLKAVRPPVIRGSPGKKRFYLSS